MTTYTLATRAINAAIADYSNKGNPASHKVENAENYLNTTVSPAILDTIPSLRKVGSRYYIDLAPYGKPEHAKKARPAKTVKFSDRHHGMMENGLCTFVKCHPLTNDKVRSFIGNSAMASAMINAAVGKKVA